MDELLTTIQVCEVLGLSRTALLFRANHGHLPSTRTGPTNKRMRLFRRSDVEAMLARDEERRAEAEKELVS